MSYSPSAKCIEKLKELEKFEPKVYADGGGLWSIGYGRRCGENEPETTEPIERAWLEQRLVQICHEVERHLPNLLGNQVDALCLLCYNIGLGEFFQSGCFNLLKGRSYGAFVHWNAYIHDNKGQVELGLVIRRQFEVSLFIYGWL